jgi:hypothetical protein
MPQTRSEEHNNLHPGGTLFLFHPFCYPVCKVNKTGCKPKRFPWSHMRYTWKRHIASSFWPKKCSVPTTSSGNRKHSSRKAAGFSFHLSQSARLPHSATQRKTVSMQPASKPSQTEGSRHANRRTSSTHAFRGRLSRTSWVSIGDLLTCCGDTPFVGFGSTEDE